MQVTEAPVSTNPRTGMPSIVSWPEMGGPTAHPIGATFFFMNGNTERAQCALSLVCIPQEMEKE